MNALLILLVLLALATLASRRGSFDEIVAFGATPLLVAAGALIAPTGIGFLPPSLVLDLDPAIAVGVLWLAMLSGVRARRVLRHLDKTSVRTLIPAFTSASIIVLATWGIFQAAASWQMPVAPTEDILPSAILVGLALVCLPTDAATQEGSPKAQAALAVLLEVLAYLSALAILAVWQSPPHAVTVGALGFLGAAIARLLSAQTGLAPTVSVLATATLLAGLCGLASVPGAIAGFVGGAAVGRLRGHPELLAWLWTTEHPVRVVVTLIVAASAGISVSHLIVGTLLGLLALLAALVTSRSAHGDALDRDRLKRVATAVAMSTTPLVIAAAFAQSGSPPAVALLPFVLVAVATADAIAFALSLVAARNGRRSVTP